MKKPHVAALERAVAIAESQSELARRIAAFLGRPTVRQQTVWYWINNEVLLEAGWWAAVEHATDQQVTRRDLRPDIFGHEKAA